ncbi:hypothetical protein KI387_022429, partial [Taxus chinensis]
VLQIDIIPNSRQLAHRREHYSLHRERINALQRARYRLWKQRGKIAMQIGRNTPFLPFSLDQPSASAFSIGISLTSISASDSNTPFFNTSIQQFHASSSSISLS